MSLGIFAVHPHHRTRFIVVKVGFLAAEQIAILNILTSSIVSTDSLWNIYSQREYQKFLANTLSAIKGT